MTVLRGVIVGLLCVWVVMVTIATLPMQIEYKFTSWALVALGPVALTAILWEVCRPPLRKVSAPTWSYYLWFVVGVVVIIVVTGV